MTIARVEAFHVADLDDTAGLVARGDDVGDFFRRIAERLLAEDMQPTRESGQHLFVVERVGRADDDGVEFPVEQWSGVSKPGTPQVAVTNWRAVADGSATPTSSKRSPSAIRFGMCSTCEMVPAPMTPTRSLVMRCP